MQHLSNKEGRLKEVKKVEVKVWQEADSEERQSKVGLCLSRLCHVLIEPEASGSEAGEAEEESKKHKRASKARQM